MGRRVGEGMAVTPGNKRRVQVRKVREGGFCEAKRQVFLDHLAGCCNVTQAAAAAGVSVNTINYHRRRDPVFAEQCAEALEAGYFALEAMTMEEAAGGGHYVPGPDADADADGEPGGARAPGPQGMNIEVALRLLSMRKAPPGRRTGRAGYEPRRATEKELDEAILAKLDVLDQRIMREREKKQAPVRGSRRRAPSPTASPSPRPSPRRGEGVVSRGR
jgi:hypothetical protein